MKEDLLREITDEIQSGSLAIGEEAGKIDSVRIMTASAWKGEGSQEYLDKLSRLSYEVESVHREIDNVLDQLKTEMG